jgi:hypothetical protein
VKKSSQIQPVGATTFPEQVTVAMSEIAENMQEGLLALAVGAGLQVMAALMDADVTELAGPKGRHDQARTAVRHGRERGSVILGWAPGSGHPASGTRRRDTLVVANHRRGRIGSARRGLAASTHCGSR